MYGDASRYQYLKELGSGTFGTVYKALDLDTENYVCIKVIKPIVIEMAKKEIMAMNIMKGVPGAIQIIEVIHDPDTNQPAIVMELLDSHGLQTREYFKTITDYQARYYMYIILSTLDAANSKGLMHRDMKGTNLIVDDETNDLRILDWGSIEWYFPGKEYTDMISNQYFRAPELMLEIYDYQYSYDIWQLGCIFSTILFKIDYIFPGLNDNDQVDKIAQTLGSAAL